MAALNISQFGGEMPTLDPAVLPPRNAVFAENAKFDRGVLEPINGLAEINAPLSVRDRSDINTVFKFQGHWLTFRDVVDCVQSPIPQDPFKRLYLTGMDAPRLLKAEWITGDGDVTKTRLLGIEPPDGAIVAVAPSGDDDDAYNDETRFYVRTHVSEDGEEGAPSAPSNLVVVKKPGDSVELSIPSLGVNDRAITHQRIYRSATSAGTSDFYLVAELPISATSFTDNIDTAYLGGLLVTQGYLPPPKKMTGLTMLSNGVMCGFVGNTICPSMPSLPYAYNPAHQLACDFDIVGIAAVPSGAIVVTTGQPYLLQGYSPDSFSLIKMESSAPCISARSIVDLGNTVIYASPTGLIATSGGEPKNITEGVISKRQWLELQPQTFIAFEYDGRYVAFGSAGGFVFDPADGAITRLSLYPQCGVRLPETAELALLFDGKLFSFDKNTEIKPQIRWRSKEFRMPPTAFSCVKVSGEKMVVKVYRDDQLHHELTLTGDREYVQRLPIGQGRSWAVEAVGDGFIDFVTLATAVGEL